MRDECVQEHGARWTDTTDSATASWKEYSIVNNAQFELRNLSPFHAGLKMPLRWVFLGRNRKMEKVAFPLHSCDLSMPYASFS